MQMITYSVKFMNLIIHLFIVNQEYMRMHNNIEIPEKS